jgi:hypothetical protein
MIIYITIISISIIICISIYYLLFTESFQGSNKDFDSANLDTFSKQLTTQVKVAGQKEYEKASQYALEMLCMRKGYDVEKDNLEGKEKDLGFRCTHTKQTCQRDSRYPSTSKNPYIIWDDRADLCINGMEAFRTFCYEQDPLLQYNISEETCKTTRPYCMSKLERFNGDCYKTFFQTLLTTMFGDFMGKILSQIAIIDVVSMIDSAARGDFDGAGGGASSYGGIGTAIASSNLPDNRTYQTDDF